MSDDQTQYDDQSPYAYEPPPPSGRIILIVVGALLALALPFVLVSQLMGPRHTSTPPPSPAGSGFAVGGTPRSASTSGALAATSLGESTGAMSAASSAATPGATSGLASGTGPLADEAESCRLANLREQAALGAASAALEQFQKHIDAMNLLVSGKITLSVATTFWDQTRVAVHEKIATFRSADTAATAGKPGCPALGPTAACTAPLDRVNAITACAKAESGRLVVIKRARAAVNTWEHHVHDMEALRSGHLSPATMSAMWQKDWKTGQREVDSYLAASKVVDAMNCPLS